LLVGTNADTADILSVSATNNAILTVDSTTTTGLAWKTTFTGNVTGTATGLSGTPNITVGTVTATTVSGNGTIPVGGIIMWSGSIEAAEALTGWKLCNGANGTPNLQDRFVVAAGSGYAVGATGGAASVSLTEEQMPSHKHGYVYATGAYIDGNGTSDIAYQSGINELEQSGRPDGQGLDKYFASTSPKGSGTAHENRPPYYALAFIMRVS